jgi:putative ABC transport system permease protein
VLDEVRSIPGVLNAAATSDLPLIRLVMGMNLRFAIEGRQASGSDEWSAGALSVSPTFFRTMGSPPLRGRAFDEKDLPRAPGVVMVDETLAHEYWPGEDPLGKRIEFLYPELRHRWFSVVGVVRDFKYDSLGAGPMRTLYLPQAQMPFRDLFLLVRTTSSPLDLVGAVKGRIRAIDHELPFGHVASMEHIVQDSLSEPRLRTWLIGLFAALALVLASAGLYGLLAYSVARRTAEIGIRLALGAGRGEVLWQVMGQGLKLAAQGIGLGLIVALILSRLLASLLFGVSTTDPLTYGVVAVLLVGVTALASYRPASRAASVDPAVALRD